MAQSKSRPRRGRTVARLAAAQALYQLEMEPVAVPALLHQWHAHRLGRPLDDDIPELAEPERPLFDDIVVGVVARRGEIDALIVAHLGAGWTLDRLDRPLRAVLRCGTYELLARVDMAVGAVISDYVDVAGGFYAGREPGFVNALLDAVARAVREPPA